MKTTLHKNSAKEGSILGIIMIMLVALSTLVLSLFQLGYHSARETEVELQKTRAFWLAEAGRQLCLANLGEKEDGTIAARKLSDTMDGTFQTIQDPNDSTKFICIGIANAGGRTITNAIRMACAFVAPQFEDVVYGGNKQNGDWTMQLRGTGAALPPTRGYGGIDSLLGDVTVYGNFQMFENSKVDVPDPNTFNVQGDVTASGEIKYPSGSISGKAYPNVGREDPPDLLEMNYAQNNDWDIAAEFDKYKISSGRLPKGHPLYNVVEKNPSNCSAENAATPGDDFYFEPSYVGSAGSPSTAVTPLKLGDDKTYYVDGHVWFHNKSTYGFKVEGTAVIVASRDIHVSDNLAYKDRGEGGDLLALVALGQHDSLGNYTTDGNIYFGDPEYGTLYTCDAFMFANNDFYYNTSANSGKQKRPDTGFKVFGNFVAINQVVILRDWYEKNTYVKNGETREAYKYRGRWYDTETRRRVYSRVTSIEGAAKYDLLKKQWVDAKDPSIILSDDDIMHYAMNVEYDERIRSAGTRLSGLPRGNGSIFKGMQSWEEISPADLASL